jgi:hypothetical protein
MIGQPMLGQEIITNSGTQLIVKPRALMQIDYWVLGAEWVGGFRV